MNRELSGRQGEDRPAAPRVYRGQAEHVREEVADLLRLGREHDRMHPGDHASILAIPRGNEAGSLRPAGSSSNLRPCRTGTDARGERGHERWVLTDMHVVGMVLHPERDCSGAVGSILDWAARRNIEVLGIDTEMRRIACTAEAVTAEELRKRADLVVSLGGDGTMLRAMRLADGQKTLVLGVNLGKLGFLAEVDVPDLPDALSAIDSGEYTIDQRLAIDSTLGTQPVTAFNDVAIVRVPGNGGSALVAVHVDNEPFVSYAADAVVVATPTGSTAYSFSAGGPIVSPAVEALLVTPAAPHSADNRGLVISIDDSLALDILPPSGRLAVEVDGQVAAYVEPGDRVELQPRPGAAHVVRLGWTTFYERVRRKLRLADSAEIAIGWP